MAPLTKITLITLFAATSAGISKAADAPSAEDREKYQQKLFARLDADSDGKVTEREFAVALLWQEFLRYDTSKDGKVSKAEYDAQEKTKDIWSQLDPEGTGSVTFEGCFKSKDVVEDLRAEWSRLTAKLKKGKKGVPHITLEDLPDLTP